MTEVPIRLCCGQRHVGVQCSDGLVMCCICFSRVPVDQLSIEDGEKVDVCAPCDKAEKQ